MNEPTPVPGVPEEINRSLSEFVGRDHVMSAIVGWLAGDERRFTLVGDPGAGKSAIVARLVQPGVSAVHAHAWHFCRADDLSTLLVENVLKSLAERLATTLDGFAEMVVRASDDQGQVTNVSLHQYVGEVQSGGSASVLRELTVMVGQIDPYRAAERLIRRPLRLLADAGKLPPCLIVVVDGLDECLALASGEETLDLLDSLSKPTATLPTQIRFLFTARRDDRVLRRFRPVGLDLAADELQTHLDIDLYARSLLEGHLPEGAIAALAHRVTEAAGGNFLYARYVLRDLLAHPERLADPGTTLPASLEEIYEDFLQRELASREALWAGEYRPLLGLLAVAQGDGLLREDLIGASGQRASQVDHATAVMSPYLAGSWPAGPFRIYHQSFRDYLLAGDRYSVYPDEAQVALTGYLLASVPGSADAEDWTKVGSYAVRYLAWHAAQCGRLNAVISTGALAHTEPQAMRAALHVDRSWPELSTVYDLAFTELADRTPAQRALALIVAALRTDAVVQDRLRSLLPAPAADVIWGRLAGEAAPLWRRPVSRPSFLHIGLGQVRNRLAVLFAGTEERDGLRLWYPEQDSISVVPGLDESHMPVTADVFVRTAGARALAGWYASVQGGGARIVDLETGEVVHDAWAPSVTAVLWKGDDPYVLEAHPVGGEVWLRPAGGPPIWRSTRDGDTSRIHRNEPLEDLSPVVTLPDRVTHLYPLASSSPAAAIRTGGGVYLLEVADGETSRFGPYPASPGTDRGIASVREAGETLVAIMSAEHTLLVVRLRDGEVIDRIRPEQMTGAVSDDIVDDLHLIGGDDGPCLLIQTRTGWLVPWSVRTRRFLPALRLRGVTGITVGAVGDRLILAAGLLGGVSLFDYHDLRAHPTDRHRDRPVEIVAVERNESAPTTAMLAADRDVSALTIIDPENGTVIEEHLLPGTRWYSEFLVLGRVGDRRVAIVQTGSGQRVAWLCWLLEGATPVPLYLEDLPGGSDLAGFRLTSLSSAQHEVHSSSVSDLLRSLIGVDLRMDVLAVDDTCRRIVGAGLLSGDIVTVAIGDTGRVTGADLLPDRTICTGIVAISGGNDLVIAMTTKSPRSIVVARLGGEEAEVLDRIPIEGYRPTIALGVHAGQLLLAAGDTSGTRIMTTVDGALTTPVRMSFEPTSLAFTRTGDLLIGLPHGIVAIHPRISALLSRHDQVRSRK